MSAPTLMIMAGGTGGHVFPALALARELRARRWSIVWLGTKRGLEARVVPAEQIEIEWLSVSGLRGKGMLAWLAAPWRLLASLREARAALRRHRPDVVIGLGGFVSGPGGIAAWLAHRPLLIHEQNAIAGLTNRVLARVARRVLCAFPDAFAGNVHATVIGNPVRADIASLPPPAERFALRRGAIRLLVIGGSQGATRLNRVVPHALARLQGRVDFDVQHQAGERWLEAARRAYAEAGMSGDIGAFIADMASAYERADLVVCRAGALTISELAAAGVAAVLVPFPAAVDDHQTHNAQILVNAGAARLIADRDLSIERLAEVLGELCAGRGKLLAMAERARQVARPAATRELADACERELGRAA